MLSVWKYVEGLVFVEGRLAGGGGLQERLEQVRLAAECWMLGKVPPWQAYDHQPRGQDRGGRLLVGGVPACLVRSGHAGDGHWRG